MLGAEGDKPVGKSGQKGKGKGKAEQSGKKGEPRKRKEGQAQAPKPDQLLEALERASAEVEEPVSPPIPEEISEVVVSAETSATETSIPATEVPITETVASVAETEAPILETVASIAETVAPILETGASIAGTEAPVLETGASIAETETLVPEMSPTAAAEATEFAPVSLQTIAIAYGNYSRKSFEQTSSFFAKLACARSFDKAIELQAAFAREAYETFVIESRRIRELYGQLTRQRLARLEGLATRMTQGALSPTRKT